MDHIQDVFTRIEKCNSLSDLENLIKNQDYNKENEKYEKKYEKNNLTISKEEIKSLQKSGIINEATNRLDMQKVADDQPLAKLLIALIWKNGDLSKVQHIIDGIMDESKSTSTQNLIFRQFGKSLANPGEPIVDQHVLRAFQLRSYQTEEEKIGIQRKSVYRNTDEAHVSRYKVWFQKQLNRIPENERHDFKQKLDHLLFVMGKRERVK